jgi:diguanylate cyclase (GGDEF)-like protein
MRPDPYAAHDPRLTRRFAGLMQLLTGGALLLLLLVSESRSETLGLAALAAFAIGTGGALLRGWRARYDSLLALVYVNLVALTVLSVLAGAQSERLEEAYLGVLLSAAALHPPRRVVPVFALVVCGIVTGKADGGITAPELVDMAMHLTIWLFVAGVSVMSVKDMREQRLHAEHDSEASQRQALTDPLTGLGNRRRLLADLDEAVAAGAPEVLALFDLDGFKAYNDTFGHPAGDALLRRLAERLAAAVNGRGRAYRMGGDEFCVLLAVAPAEREAAIARAVDALSEDGESFAVRPSHGVIDVPAEASTAAEALRIADHRMYARKSSGRASAARQSTDVLLRVLAERLPALGEHLEGVGAMCDRVARAVGVPAEDLPALVQAAELHDVGKAAIPDAILNKPGPLDDDEWAFMRRHTIIGERIVAAAPALTRVAGIVRSSHERFDGAGYPDGLAGEAIPLASRIIFVCDAFDAMVADRPYRAGMSTEAALAELRRCAGTQFDPVVVAALCALVADQAVAG